MSQKPWTAGYCCPEFFDFIKARKRNGVNGIGEKVHYMRRSDLEEFWQVRKIREVLQSANPPIEIDADRIRSDFLPIFSVLVYIREVGTIEWFLKEDIDGSRLPLSDKYHVEKGCTMTEEVLAKFVKEQWLFCPLSLCRDYDIGWSRRPYKRDLQDRHVIPIPEWLDPLPSHDRGKEIYIVDWPEKLDRCSDSGPTKVVFKVFDIEARSRGEKEATILHNLQDAKPHPNIVLPYGSFIQSGRYYIALEYANEGSLLDYFYRGPSFPDQRSLENFFEQLFALYSALQKLEDPRYKIVHRDIKPSNILVFRQPDGGLILKLTDFECASTSPPKGAGHRTYSSDDGSRTYSAPERAVFNSLDKRARQAQSTSWQTFELGAVISESFIWAAFGNGGREKYCEYRRREIVERKPAADPAGYGCAFHDGIKVLACVSDWHGRAAGELWRFNHVCHAVRRVLEDRVLVPKRRRLKPPMKVNDEFQGFMDRARRRGELPRSHSQVPMPWHPHSQESANLIHSNGGSAISLPIDHGGSEAVSYDPTGLGILRNASGRSRRETTHTRCQEELDQPSPSHAAYDPSAVHWNHQSPHLTCEPKSPRMNSCPQSPQMMTSRRQSEATSEMLYDGFGGSSPPERVSQSYYTPPQEPRITGHGSLNGTMPGFERRRYAHDSREQPAHIWGAHLSSPARPPNSAPQLTGQLRSPLLHTQPHASGQIPGQLPGQFPSALLHTPHQRDRQTSPQRIRVMGSRSYHSSTQRQPAQNSVPLDMVVEDIYMGMREPTIEVPPVPQDVQKDLGNVLLSRLAKSTDQDGAEAHLAPKQIEPPWWNLWQRFRR